MLALAAVLIAYTLGAFDGVVRPQPRLSQQEADDLNKQVQKAVEQRDREVLEGKAKTTNGA